MDCVQYSQCQSSTNVDSSKISDKITCCKMKFGKYIIYKIHSVSNDNVKTKIKQIHLMDNSSSM